MMQSFIPEDLKCPEETSKQIIPIPTHPKIKPLIRTHNQKIDLDELDLRKFTRSYGKASDAGTLHLDLLQKPRWSSKKCQKVFKSQQKLSSLDCSFERPKECQNSHIFSTISSLSALSSLALKFSSLEGYEAIASKSLFKSLACLKNLSSLDLDFSFVNIQDPKIFNSLFKSLRKIPALTNLSLAFIFCFGLDSLHFRSLSAGLEKLTKLHTLKLFLSNSKEVNDSSINILASSFPNLPLLNKIDLTLQTDSIQGSTLVDLFIQLRKLKFLSDIKLNVNGTQVIKENYYKDPIAEALECLDFALLKRLSLHLSQDAPDSISLGQISQVLRRFDALTHFHLHFDAKRNPVPLELESFTSNLGYLNSLTSLKFNFPCGLWSLDFMENLAVALESLPNLVQLSLDFGSSSIIEDAQFQTLFKNLRLLKALKYLDLCFSHQEKITNKSIRFGCQSLKELVLLRDLVLDFGSASLLTNKAIQAIAGAIRSLKDLFRLTLNFGKNFEIDDEAVKAVVQALKHLPYLFSFKMSISKSPNVQDFDGLINALLEMNNLREIELSLPNPDIRVYDPKCLIKTKRIKAMVI